MEATHLDMKALKNDSAAGERCNVVRDTAAKKLAVEYPLSEFQGLDSS